MNKEELIKKRDKLNNIVLAKTKRNKKWGWFSFINIFISILLIIIPGMIVGGGTKPPYFYVLVILGLVILFLGVLSLVVFIINFKICNFIL